MDTNPLAGIFLLALQGAFTGVTAGLFYLSWLMFREAESGGPGM
jgi:hypothetical protein